MSICSPNYLHDSHIRFALRHGAIAICEKPLVLNPWNVDALTELEKETGRSVRTILQLRLHPRIIKLRDEILGGPRDKVYNVELTYVTSRGKWYHHSWKGDTAKSGGIATNIGIHFFDMLIWIFGEVQDSSAEYTSATKAKGKLRLRRANVSWLLSINSGDLPSGSTDSPRTWRSLRLDGNEIEFSDGFNDLHTSSYVEILSGQGFTLKDARPSIQLASTIRDSQG